MSRARSGTFAIQEPAAPAGAHASPKASAAAVPGVSAAPALLIMDGSGRLAHARRGRNRTGSGSKRAPNSEPEVVVGVPVAGGRAEILWTGAPGTAADGTVT
ncbi:MAG: hypothetical protein L0Y57_15035 [Beijerinckiaceae bacterium]|nr:hypothetical protein [Beijerinckiaceae bacterium]